MSALLCKQLQIALRASVVIDSSSVRRVFQWAGADYRGLLSETGQAITTKIFPEVVVGWFFFFLGGGREGKKVHELNCVQVESLRCWLRQNYCRQKDECRTLR